MKGLLSLVACTVLVRAPVLPAQTAGAASPVGWYRTPDGASVLISPAPGQGYRRLDFERASFDAIDIGSGENDHRWVPPDEGGPALVAPDGARWLPVSDPPYTVETVGFEAVDGTRLAGLLLRPSHPIGRGAVMIHGSGTSDRDNVWAYTFAHALASRGLDVLFPDKRGSGDSGGDWRAVGFDALARDAVAGADLLVERTGLAPAEVGWVGLSQGGWIAPLAARFSGRGAFVVSVSSAAVTVFDQIAFEVANAMRADGLSEEAIARAMELQRQIRAYALGQVGWEAYTGKRQETLDGPGAPFAEAMPSDPSDWRWEWWARIGDFDPVESWASAALPTLVMYGAEDERDNVPVERSVQRLSVLARRPGVERRITTLVMPDMGHTLVDEETGWVSREALDRLVEFVATGTPR